MAPGPGCTGYPSAHAAMRRAHKRTGVLEQLMIVGMPDRRWYGRGRNGRPRRVAPVRQGFSRHTVRTSIYRLVRPSLRRIRSFPTLLRRGFRELARLSSRARRWEGSNADPTHAENHHEVLGPALRRLGAASLLSRMSAGVDHQLARCPICSAAVGAALVVESTGGIYRVPGHCRWPGRTEGTRRSQAPRLPHKSPIWYQVHSCAALGSPCNVPRSHLLSHAKVDWSHTHH